MGKSQETELISTQPPNNELAESVNFSVLVACHNNQETIHSCIKSLLYALNKDDEVLVLLDICTDGSELVVRSFVDTRVKVFKSETRLGRDGARNFLFKQSKGKFISILDADDVTFPWRFYFARRLLAKHDLVFGTAIVFGDGIRPYPFLPQVPRRIHASRMASELLERNPLVHSTCSMKREVFEAVNGYMGEEGEDYLFWLMAASCKYRMVRGALPVSGYRIHSRQATQMKGFEKRVLSSPIVRSKRKELESILQSKGEETIHRSKIFQAAPHYGIMAWLESKGLPLWAKPRGLRRD